MDSTTSDNIEIEKSTAKKSSGGFMLGMVCLLVLGVGAFSGYTYWLQLGLKHNLAATTEQINNQSRMIETSTNKLQSGLSQLNLDSKKMRDENASDIKLLQERLNSYQQRLLALSTTSREDWLLAEALYLLTLANQRLVVEREVTTAGALLANADDILAGIGDLELRDVRQAIKTEQIALKLADVVDREGVYLEIAALAEHIDNLRVLKVPEIKLNKPVEKSAAEGLSFFQRFKQSITLTLADFSDYVRINSHREPIEPILPPDQLQYLKQNIRFMLEQAQLALLKEQPNIYRKALLKSAQWIQRYYAINAQENSAILDGIERLAQIDIVQSVPDISQSRVALEAYIEKLHKLKPVEETKGTALHQPLTSALLAKEEV